MKATYANLVNSRFFNPAFNSAIFDGPVRIYFAQFHESLALKVYFGLQQKYGDLLHDIKTRHRAYGQSCLIMLYPSQDSFAMAFEGVHDLVIEDQLGEDKILGVNGPFDDDRLSEILSFIAMALGSLQKSSSEVALVP
ncbi:MAG: hypothetical protein C5B49_11780 [Bdellovibrio sp.]|nr:MAG: hypothetical protein C5B49_11780 [Bdellovibrio sp.]